jgi:hypothetical protein
MLNIVFLASSQKHHISEQDIVHALTYLVRVEHQEELTMIIGPSRKGHMLEIGTSTSEDSIVVFHAMPARRKFLR